MLVAVPLAMWLHQNEVVQYAGEELAFVIMVAMVSVVPGLVLGATTEYLLKRGRSRADRVGLFEVRHRPEWAALARATTGPFARRSRRCATGRRRGAVLPLAAQAGEEADEVTRRGRVVAGAWRGYARPCAEFSRRVVPRAARLPV